MVKKAAPFARGCRELVCFVSGPVTTGHYVRLAWRRVVRSADGGAPHATRGIMFLLFSRQAVGGRGRRGGGARPRVPPARVELQPVWKPSHLREPLP